LRQKCALQQWGRYLAFVQFMLSIYCLTSSFAIPCFFLSNFQTRHPSQPASPPQLEIIYLLLPPPPFACLVIPLPPPPLSIVVWGNFLQILPQFLCRRRRSAAVAGWQSIPESIF
jgi:hypothetical protein